MTTPSTPATPATPSAQLPRAEIVVDLDAIRHNVRLLHSVVGVPVMVVVKADGYGHGMIPVARAAREAGATWLGVATLDEAIALRAGGDRGRLLCWLAAPTESYADVVAADVDVTASSVSQLEQIIATAGAPARVQLKVDTGLSRNGAVPSEWAALFAAAVAAEAAGTITVTGLWSHFAASDEPTHPANDAQEQEFRRALALAQAAGLHPEVSHLSNSAAALLRPSARFDLVRCGVASYGLNPAPGELTDPGLIPAMTVRGQIAIGKDIPVGAGVSYGHTFIADRPMHVALVPMGYGDGIPRHASSRAEVQVRGRRAPVLGRICMDQFVVEAPGAEAGDEVVLFGPGTEGEPTAQDWAHWCQTINYEIVTRIGGRQVRRWVGV